MNIKKGNNKINNSSYQNQNLRTQNNKNSNNFIYDSNVYKFVKFPLEGAYFIQSNKGKAKRYYNITNKNQNYRYPQRESIHQPTIYSPRIISNTYYNTNGNGYLYNDEETEEYEDDEEEYFITKTNNNNYYNKMNNNLNSSYHTSTQGEKVKPLFRFRSSSIENGDRNSYSKGNFGYIKRKASYNDEIYEGYGNNYHTHVSTNGYNRNYY